jgi:hypothetical protein
VKCSGGRSRNQRAQFVRSTFDWEVCSEPLARLRRTRDYGYSIAGLRCIGNGKVSVVSKSPLTLVTGPRIAAFVELLNGYKEAFSDVKTHFR